MYVLIFSCMHLDDTNSNWKYILLPFSLVKDLREKIGST